jgi:hypothetical protein
MRFVWQTWNVAHIARHGLTPPQVEALFALPKAEFHSVPGGRSQMRAQLHGQTFRVVFLQEDNGTIFVITCHREHPERRFP